MIIPDETLFTKQLREHARGMAADIATTYTLNEIIEIATKDAETFIKQEMHSNTDLLEQEAAHNYYVACFIDAWHSHREIMILTNAIKSVSKQIDKQIDLMGSARGDGELLRTVASFMSGNDGKLRALWAIARKLGHEPAILEIMDRNTQY